MNGKRYVLCALVVWVLIFVMEYLLHAVLLAGQYEQIRHILRPEESAGAFFFWVLLAELILAFGMTYIFIKGYENRGLGEGFRFGLLVGVTFSVSTSLVNYAVFPLPASLTAAYVIGYPVEMIVAGLAMAALYKPKTVK
ncbi:MAG TPA: hypothetical protein VN285_01205 [Candidatus Deferrimicrobium sp.]|nr:hypothetical protein [Candidatus Deferrimicrobium sp.]